MIREFKFLLRDKAALLWLILAFMLSAIAVTFGLREVSAQRAEIAELIALDQIEQEVVLSEQSDWGGLAYYTFHMTYDPPSDFAFAAIGQRDSLPWKHRIRMLALEGQIHESDAVNPDFALIGRVDYAFLLSLLVPLLIILLLYDLRSSERIAGRLELLEVSAGSTQRIWLTRAILRVSLLALVILAPLWAAGFISGTSASILLKTGLLTIGYICLWTALIFWLAKAQHNSARNLTSLIGLWVLVCTILPVLNSEITHQAIPVSDGADIILTQREAVNDAWDIPKEATYAPFLERHPNWADYTGWDSTGFEWKWYYAFQQVGDQTAEPLSLAYTQSRKERDKLAGRLSLISPASFVHRALEHWAHTDTQAALEYEAKIRDYHKALREYYYPRLFEGRGFDTEDVDIRPVFAKD